jgi:hypothetical protein
MYRFARFSRWRSVALGLALWSMAANALLPFAYALALNFAAPPDGRQVVVARTTTGPKNVLIQLQRQIAADFPGAEICYTPTAPDPATPARHDGKPFCPVCLIAQTLVGGPLPQSASSPIFVEVACVVAIFAAAAPIRSASWFPEAARAPPTSV